MIGLGSAVASVLGGSQLGGIGVIANGVISLFSQKQKDKHELEMLQTQIALVTAQGANAVTIENAKAFSRSFDSDKATYVERRPAGWLGLLFDALMTFVDFMRGITRPGLCWYYTLVTSAVCFYAFQRVGVDDAFLKRMVELSLGCLLEMAAVSGTYWFGTRSLQRLAGKI